MQAQAWAAVDRKYPNRGRSWPWQWLFPATRWYLDAASGEHRRHHLHPSAMQRAMTAAVLYTHVLNWGRLGVRSPAELLSGLGAPERLPEKAAFGNVFMNYGAGEGRSARPMHVRRTSGTLAHDRFAYLRRQ